MAAKCAMLWRVGGSEKHGTQPYNKHQGQKVQPAMKESIVLYHLERPDIKINIVARFEEGKLVIDGYDIGKTVKTAWGSSDYEYVMAIPTANLPRVYGLLNVKVGDRMSLLTALAQRFHGNRCFSAIGEFLEENEIEYESSTWA